MRALQERGAVVLVPGGQAELVHTWRRTHHGEFVVYCRHKGMCPIIVVGCVTQVSTRMQCVTCLWYATLALQQCQMTSGMPLL